MGSSNQLMVALDLVCGQYVCIPADPADPRTQGLRDKSIAGDRTLVCALCYAEHGRKVPVVVRSHLGGQRRPHFAHPSDCAPPEGQHNPETVWHLTSKSMLATWARRQPGAVEVRTEVWLPNRERRADVRVVFADKREVAIEIQGNPLTDAEWTNRHRDYRHNNVVDIWLWHPDIRPHRIVLNDPDHQQQLWAFDPDRRSMTLMVGAPHRTLWPEPPTQDDIIHRVPHLPPCVHDELIPHHFSLDELTLTLQGIAIPTALQESLAAELSREHNRTTTLIRQQQNHNQDKHARPPHGLTASAPATQEVVSPTAPRPAVDEEQLAHLKRIELQNHFMRVGHVPAYQDAPRLRRPDTKHQLVQCINCGRVLSPRTTLTDIPTCTPTAPDNGQSPQASNLPLHARPEPNAPASRLTTSSKSVTQARSTTGCRAPVPDQLRLF
ncbi:competence protein CoiA family protein [Nocardia vaccinii]|uniref:competence protein CoiA family protein n=1 Tax=Nocardia vaccinii TaxID=1822 RepID=UPI001C3F7CDC|nr:competence protein CoiA family protein [Nocardia vaccinii]